MAGLPPTVIERSKEILSDLEKDGSKRRDTLGGVSVAPKSQKLQMTLFEAEEHPIVEELRGLDINTLSPVEALIALQRLQKRL